MYGPFTTALTASINSLTFGNFIVCYFPSFQLSAFPGFSLYGATKAWLNSFTQSLAVEGKPFGVRVFGVGPGAVETQMLRGAFPDFPADQTLQPDDIAAAIEWLLDERAEHISGQTIYVKK